jgi:fucose 4-O-acetylase-like acetyltransferase
MRNQAMDIAKGIAIILVAFGHTLIGVQAAMGETVIGDTALIVIYSFHMALFFMASGLFIQSALEEPLPKFGMRLLERIVWPYFLWSFILLYAHHFMSNYTNSAVETVDPVSVLYWPPAVMWFLYALFFGFLAARLLRPLPPQIRWIAAVNILAGGYVVPFPDLRLYMHSVGLFLIASEIGPKRVFDLSRNLVALIVSFVIMVGIGVMAWIEGQHVLEGYPAGGPQYLPAAFAGSLLLVALSRCIEYLGRSRAIGWLSNSLAYVGRRTMPIFVSHVLLTAGVRIAMRLAGVDNGGAILVAGTALSISLPLAAYEIALRLRLARILGWR